MFTYMPVPPLEETESRYTPIYKESPLAPVRLVDKKVYWNWEVLRCPYCEGTHVHGGISKRENPLQYLGGRMAHCNPEDFVSWEVRDASPCWNGNAEYRLIAITGDPTPDEMDAHFPTAKGTDLDGYHISNWTDNTEHNERYRAYITHVERNANGYVYLIEAGGHFKIGVARDVNKRIASIATNSPFPIEIVHTALVASPYAFESFLHDKCAGERVHREWFALDANLVDQVMTLMTKEALA